GLSASGSGGLLLREGARGQQRRDCGQRQSGSKHPKPPHREFLRFPSTGLHGLPSCEGWHGLLQCGPMKRRGEGSGRKPTGNQTAVPVRGGVDCDLHPAVPHLTSLLPYMNDYWRDQVTTRGMVDLVSQSYPTNSPISARPDWRPAKGKPGSSLDDMQKQALDPFKVAYGICNPLYGVQIGFSEDLADPVCPGANDLA